ncbi:MAG: hypothetical protein HXX18_03035 [Bacteroidetes bacterium]|nr:hypothetical protein [Bacteroidota bacterium]
MSNNEDLKRQEELAKRIQEQAKQEQEKQIRREEELRRIRESQVNQKQQQDDIIKGKPTSGRPGKDD